MRIIALCLLVCSGCYLDHVCNPGEWSCVKELTVKPAGLYTNPNPLSEVPDGALEVATNVVFRRPGIMEPRPGVISFFSAVSGDIWKLMGYYGSRTYYGGEFTGPEKRIYAIDASAPGDEILDQSGASIQFTQFQLRNAVAQNDLFFTTDAGVLRTSAGTTVAYAAGIPPALNIFAALQSTGTPTALATGRSVAYRVAYVRYTPSNRLIIGTPSGRAVIGNSSGATRDVSVSIPLAAALIAGDRVHVYRTVSSATTPNDEMRLVADIELSSTDITNKSITYKDTTVDASLTGAFLYTNETAQGAIRSNERPPYATDIASHASRMWYAGARSPHEMSLDISRFGEPVDGVFADVGTGDFTTGSPTIANVAGINYDGLRVGQWISDTAGPAPATAGTNIPANTTIVSWDSGANTITMSANALATNVGATTYLGDTMTVEGVKFYATPSTFDSTNHTFRYTNPAQFAYLLAGGRIFYSMTVIAQVDEVNVAGGDTAISLRIMRADYANSAFTFVTTSPYSINSANLVLSTKTVTSTADGGNGRLMWSKTLESDAVPLVAFADLGDTNKAILRILPTRDSLFVLKEDGVWRVSNIGDDIEDVRIDPFDTTLQLVHRNAACVMNNRIWAWTTRGIVAFNESGVLGPIDEPIDNITSPHMRSVLHGGSATYLYLAADELNNELIVGLPDGTAVYVFNVEQSAWSKWTLGISGSFTGATRDALTYINPSNDSGHLFFATDDAVLVAYEDPSPGSTPSHWDGLYSRTATTADATSITVSVAVTTASKGSMVVQGSEVTYLTEDVSSATVLPVEDGSAFTAGAVTVYAGFVSQWQFTDRFAGDPGIEKHYREVAMLYEGTGVPVQYIAYGQWGSTAAANADQPVDPDTVQVLGIGREAARGTRLGVLVGGSRVDVDWSLLGATFTFEQGGRAR